MKGSNEQMKMDLFEETGKRKYFQFILLFLLYAWFIMCLNDKE